MQLKLQKIGHSLMVTIPKVIREKIDLSVGDTLKMDLKKDTIQLKPVKKKQATEMLGNLNIARLELKKTVKYIKEAPYAR